MLGTSAFAFFTSFVCSSSKLRLGNIGTDSFRVFPGMFNWIEVWTLAGKIRDLHRLSWNISGYCHAEAYIVYIVSGLEDSDGRINQNFLHVWLLSSYLLWRLVSHFLSKYKCPQHDAATTKLERRDGVGQVISKVCFFFLDMTLGF